MDDYRDLVAASLTLVCAAIMLVAGQLYIEHHPTPASQPFDLPQQPQTSPALISHAPSPHGNTIEQRQDVENNRTG